VKAAAKAVTQRPAPAKSKSAKPAKTGARPAPAKAAPPTRTAAPVSARGASKNGGANGPPVPSNDKPRKNQAGFSSKELEHFRDLLLAKRREIVGDVSSMEREALRSSGGSNLSTLPIHMADMGTDNYEQEFTLGLVQKERDLLKEINVALSKIQNGTYGLCEGTGQPIIKERLEYQPWARFSVEHQRKLERHGR